MKEERIWQLVGLKLSGEATAGELAELTRLLEANPELASVAEEVEQAWKSRTESHAPAVEDAFGRHMQKFSTQFTTSALQEETANKAQTGRKNFSVVRKTGWITAAAAAAVFAFVLLFPFKQKNTVSAPVAANIVTTKPGSKSKINLPDGTLVWLNADSKMTYYENYGVSTREVELTGEAYFDVVKDKSRPFIIHTKSINVKVLGTAFNVRSYVNEKTSETSLIRGSVEVTLISEPGKRIILKPNQKLVVQNNQLKPDDKQKESPVTDAPLLTLLPLHYRKGDSSSVETYWIKNKLSFDSETLETVAKKIERWYDVKVTIVDDRLKAEKYTSDFDDESLAEVMEALHYTGNFHYTINRKEVVIKP